MRFLLFQGDRMPRTPYWVLTIAGGIAGRVTETIPDPFVDHALSYALAYIEFCIICARLRDAGFSPWLALIPAVPLIVAVTSAFAGLLGLFELAAFITFIIGIIFIIAIGIAPTKVPVSDQAAVDEPQQGEPASNDNTP